MNISTVIAQNTSDGLDNSRDTVLTPCIRKSVVIMSGVKDDCNMSEMFNSTTNLSLGLNSTDQNVPYFYQVSVTICSSLLLAKPLY